MKLRLPLYIVFYLVIACTPDYAETATGRRQTVIQSCGADDFRCNDYQCIPHNMWCNGHINCQDGSDEQNCGRVDDPDSTSDIADKKTLEIPQAEINAFVSKLLAEDEKDAADRVTVNLQNKKTNDDLIDSAIKPLLTMNSATRNILTIKGMLSRIDYVDEDQHFSEVSGSYRLPTHIMNTAVMNETWTFLKSHQFFTGDRAELRDHLRFWFNLRQKELRKYFKLKIFGVYNWIYFSELELINELDYLGYIESAKIDDNRSVVKVYASIGGSLERVTMFVGTSPEFETALYTMCYFMRRNDVDSCPMTLNNVNVTIHIVSKEKKSAELSGQKYLYSAYPELNRAQTLSVPMIGSVIVMLSIYNNFL